MSLWSNIAGPFFFADEVFRECFSGGAELIEQIPLTENWKLGLTQHFSRNGREAYLDPGTPEGFMALRIDEPSHEFYKEAGGGLYASFKTKKAKFAFEFRYGRDIDDKRNRFALTFDFWNLSEMSSKEENREGEDEIEKMQLEMNVKI